MTNDQKFELKVQQIEDAMNRLERYKALGWEIQIKSSEALIDKLIKELDRFDQ
jgi:hypothetical protein